MGKNILLLFFISSIGAAQVGAIRKVATTAALAGSAASLAWLGSQYSTIDNLHNEQNRGMIAATTKITDPHIEELMQPLLPQGMKVELREHRNEGSYMGAAGFVCQTPQANYLSLKEGTFNKGFLANFAGPWEEYVARHEASHLFYGHHLESKNNIENFCLGAGGLSAGMATACLRNLKRPVSPPVAAASLVVMPLYVLGYLLSKGYKVRENEFQATLRGVQTMPDRKLAQLQWQWGSFADQKSSAIYKKAYDRWRAGEIPFDSFWMTISHPTGKDQYDMATTEMNKRGLKPLNRLGL